MNEKDYRHKLEIRFSKNRHYPEYGPNAYSNEGVSVYIPFGKTFQFINSNAAVDFVKSKIDNCILDKYDSICITKWNGCHGVSEYLKTSNTKSDESPIDEEFAKAILKF